MTLLLHLLRGIIEPRSGICVCSQGMQSSKSFYGIRYRTVRYLQRLVKSRTRTVPVLPCAPSSPLITLQSAASILHCRWSWMVDIRYSISYSTDRYPYSSATVRITSRPHRARPHPIPTVRYRTLRLHLTFHTCKVAILIVPLYGAGGHGTVRYRIHSSVNL